MEKARAELYKPKEDVVAYHACTYSRSALYHYLSCLYVPHVQEEDKVEKGEVTLDELVSLVGAKHDEVKEMDFSSVRCIRKDVKDVLNDDEIYFCNNVDQINTCTDLAKKIRKLVINTTFEGVEPEFASS